MTECMSSHSSQIVNLLIDWLVYRVNWLRAKAARDRWAEEVELVTSEFQWTVSFFENRSRSWREHQRNSLESGKLGHASYSARQATLYDRLRGQCEKIINRTINAGSVVEVEQ